MDNIIVDVQTGKITNRPYSPEEQADVKARQDKRENERPMREWKQKIAETDAGMPRFAEDILDGMPDKSGVAKITLDRLQAKKTLRETKP